MAAAKRPVLNDINFTLAKGKPTYKVVSVLQDQFRTPAKTKEDGTVGKSVKLQGRLLFDALLEALLLYASAETLSKLADEVKDKGEGDKKGKASEYIAAIFGARSVAPTASGASVSLDNATPEQLRARLEALEAAQAPGSKTKGVAAL